MPDSRIHMTALAIGLFANVAEGDSPPRHSEAAVHALAGRCGDAPVGALAEKAPVLRTAVAAAQAGRPETGITRYVSPRTTAGCNG